MLGGLYDSLSNALATFDYASLPTEWLLTPILGPFLREVTWMIAMFARIAPCRWNAYSFFEQKEMFNLEDVYSCCDTASDTSKSPTKGHESRLHGKTLWVVSLCLYFSLVMGFLESSAVGTILVSVGKEFDDTMHVQWVVLAYMLTYLGFSIIFSRVSDVIGRKWTTIAAAAIITGASIACGFAQNLPQLIAFRAVQGLGGAGLYAMPTIILPEITPIEYFNLMGAMMGMSMTVSAVCGPFVGGAITTHSSWRWVFWMNAPCGGLIILLLLLFCPPINPPQPMRWKQLDLVGCILYLSTSVLPIFALQQSGSGEFAWTSIQFIACIVSGGVTSLVLAAWIPHLSTGKHTIQPLFPSRILLHRIMLCTILVSLLIGYVFFAVMIELPQRFQVVNGKTPEQAGICLLAVSGASTLGSIVGVAASSKRNLTFWTMNVGSAFVLLGAGLLYTITPSKAVSAKIFGFEVIVGFGLGIIASASTIVIKIEAKVEDAAAAQGLTSQSRLIGGNLGLAISTVLLNHHITADLGGKVSPEMLNRLRHSLLALSEATPAQQDAVRTIFAESFQKNMLACMCIAALALVIGLLSYQKNPPNLVQMPREGKSPSLKAPTPQQEFWRSGKSTVAESHRDVESQSALTPRSFWSELPTTPIFVDQFVHAYDSPSLSEQWSDLKSAHSRATSQADAQSRIRKINYHQTPSIE